MVENTNRYTGDSYADKVPFFEAIFKGDAAFIRDYVARGYALGQRNDAQNTELGYSIVCCQEAISILLMDLGSRPDERCGGQRTALHLALEMGSENVAVNMIARGVDIRAKDKWGGSPIATIKSGNLPRAHQALWRTMDELEKKLELQDIARRDRADTLKLLVEEDGVDLLERYESLKPFIDMAVSSGQTKIATYVGEKQAEKAIKDFEANRIVIDRAATEPTQTTLKRVPSISFKRK